MEMITFLTAPFVMCLILVGIHCYLGIHVLRRGVIFVDLSLAQVASLGSTTALLLEYDHHQEHTYFISLGFTLCAALFFSLAKKVEKFISQEVLIAIVYAFSSALVVLIVSSLAHGAEHIKEVLTGKILWVDWNDVAKTALIYASVGLVHYIFRKQLIDVSFRKKSKFSFGWDFLFYALFGVVITTSVGSAGILLVFSFLVVPALFSINLAKTIKGQLFIGWGLGVVMCVIGLLVSVEFDFPAGATMVVVFTLTAIVSVLSILIFSELRRVFPRKKV